MNTPTPAPGPTDLDLVCYQPDLLMIRDLIERLERRLWRCYGDTRELRGLALALSEACVNVVVHGGGASFIRLIGDFGKDQVTVTMLDDSAEFDLSAVKASLPDDPLAVSGRGLFLIHQCVDTLSYQRVSHQNQHRFEVRLVSSTQAPDAQTQPATETATAA